MLTPDVRRMLASCCLAISANVSHKITRHKKVPRIQLLHFVTLSDNANIDLTSAIFAAINFYVCKNTFPCYYRYKNNNLNMQEAVRKSERHFL